jgi:hypothetical protein
MGVIAYTTILWRRVRGHACGSASRLLFYALPFPSPLPAQTSLTFQKSGLVFHAGLLCQEFEIRHAGV